jgi:hypothetical protein
MLTAAPNSNLESPTGIKQPTVSAAAQPLRKMQARAPALGPWGAPVDDLLDLLDLAQRFALNAYQLAIACT